MKHPDAVRHRGVTVNDPKSSSTMFSHMEVEGGEIFTRLHSSCQEMTWCPCVVYAKNLKALITEFIRKKIKGIEGLEYMVMDYLFPHTRLPIDIAFEGAIEDPDIDSEDVAYFIDVRWVEE